MFPFNTAILLMGVGTTKSMGNAIYFEEDSEVMREILSPIISLKGSYFDASFGFYHGFVLQEGLKCLRLVYQ